MSEHGPVVQDEFVSKSELTELLADLQTQCSADVQDNIAKRFGESRQCVVATPMQRTAELVQQVNDNQTHKSPQTEETVNQIKRFQKSMRKSST